MDSTPAKTQFVGCFNLEMVIMDEKTMSMKGVASIVVSKLSPLEIVYSDTYTDDPEKVQEIEFY